MTGPLCTISVQGSPVASLKFQMAPRLILLMSSGSKKKEPRYVCLGEAKASHSQRMWAEVSSSTPHLLHSGLSESPIRWRCLLRVLCPVRRPVTALDCVLLKDRNLALAPRRGPKINSRVCLWVSPRPRHHIQCWLTNQNIYPMWHYTLVEHNLITVKYCWSWKESEKTVISVLSEHQETSEEACLTAQWHKNLNVLTGKWAPI